MNDEEEKKSFLENQPRGILGCINGIFLYELLWPFVTVFILQIVLMNKYSDLVTNHQYMMTLVIMIVTSVFTLVSSLFIAKPSKLLSAYSKPIGKDVKFILKALGAMFLFSYMHNFILLIFGVDVVGGNANQGAVLELIQSNKFLAFIAMVILAPILEEITYRYFLYGTVAKYNRKWAIVVSGLVFMSVHAIASFTQNVDDIVRELLLLPPYMFSGMVLAYAYDKKENLVIPTAIHALNNLISFMLCMI